MTTSLLKTWTSPAAAAVLDCAARSGAAAQVRAVQLAVARVRRTPLTADTRFEHVSAMLAFLKTVFDRKLTQAAVRRCPDQYIRFQTEGTRAMVKQLAVMLKLPGGPAAAANAGIASKRMLDTPLAKAVLECAARNGAASQVAAIEAAKERIGRAGEPGVATFALAKAISDPQYMRVAVRQCPDHVLRLNAEGAKAVLDVMAALVRQIRSRAP
jgi:hypothetical protein